MFPMEDLTWRPLSSNNSKKAQTWVTFLKFPHTEDDSSKAYPVEVRIGHSQGIVSSSVSKFQLQFSFTVCIYSESEAYQIEECRGSCGFENVELE
ncbi:hypothetical protein IFM89_029237 [Coptis chinensis]|uniref:Uncharacterized protein n=1 Tax=Coptis chinensis TaxID=261450 RepID=A0A835ISS8_9MAGN|nr:hypothetical protein IFM89_029237 [Coptis chinensis]